MMKKLRILTLIFVASSVFFASCEKVEEPTPTNELMEGVWELTEAYEGDSIVTDKVTSFFPSYVHLDNSNSVNSTMGPLFMYIVYGDSKFINITSKMDEVFSYMDVSLTEGEWFIDKNKVVDNFTVEMKLKFPTMQTLTDIFDLLDVNLPEVLEDGMDLTIYHRFKYVSIIVDEDYPDEMIWEFTENVAADYNVKDMYGDKVAYTGIPADGFSKCRLVFSKRVKSITDLVTESAAAQGTKAVAQGLK